MDYSLSIELDKTTVCVLELDGVRKLYSNPTKAYKAAREALGQFRGDTRYSLYMFALESYAKACLFNDYGVIASVTVVSIN